MKGELCVDEDLVIAGTLRGSIRQENGRLSIGRSARVQASVRTGSAVIAGLFEGDVSASGTIVVKKSARLSGRMTATRLCLEAGAQVEDVILSGRIERIPAADD